jgi:2-C-methyl-D-erythritol 4-phosphate cytidylyltransferase
MRYWLVMPAAGVGRRFGENIPKQYADLRGRTVMEWSLAPFLYDSRCLGVVVVLGQEDSLWPTVAARLPNATAATQIGDEGAVTLPKLVTAPGGRERSDSVRNGLAALSGRAEPNDWVLVHDAARPCVLRQDVDRLLDRVQSHLVGGLLAAPAADTLKRCAQDKEVLETVDRSGLWRALTPQMFRYRALCDALDRCQVEGRSPTDEAQALEWMGEHPLVVEGSTTNIKITSADDLTIARALLGETT